MPHPLSRFDTHPKLRLSTFEAKIKLAAIPMILQKKEGTVNSQTAYWI